MLKLCINSRDELFVLDLDKHTYKRAEITRVSSISAECR